MGGNVGFIDRGGNRGSYGGFDERGGGGNGGGGGGDDWSRGGGRGGTGNYNRGRQDGKSERRPYNDDLKDQSPAGNCKYYEHYHDKYSPTFINCYNFQLF